MCSKKLDEYNEKILEGKQADYRTKEVILFLIASLRSLISEKADILKNVETLLRTHVLPELQNG